MELLWKNKTIYEYIYVYLKFLIRGIFFFLNWFWKCISDVHFKMGAIPHEV